MRRKLLGDNQGSWKKDEENQHEKGFAKTGEHSFFMGDDEQIDWIMVKEL